LTFSWIRISRDTTHKTRYDVNTYALSFTLTLYTTTSCNGHLLNFWLFYWLYYFTNCGTPRLFDYQRIFQWLCYQVSSGEWLKKENFHILLILEGLRHSLDWLRTEMLPLGFAINVINSTTIDSRTWNPYFIFLRFFLPLKMTRRRVEIFEI